MEKLQAALDKARKTRQENGPESPRAPAKPTRAARSGDVEDLWQALPAIQIDDRTLEKHRLVTQVANTKATPFDILRTKVLLQMRQNGWKRIAITSPMPNSGKTTTACNLALSLGRQSDLRSMVLDFDLRDPSVKTFLNHTPQIGLGDVISGNAEFADQAVRIGPNVAFSMANKPESDPARLLLAEETANVIDRIELEYKPDVMIFDLPSMLINDDTRAFLKNVDCALVVIRAGKTRYKQFDISEREIAEQTNVVGVVLNAYQHADVAKSGE
ncbi:CpsD/CapB family tyrosine-protein kinase [Octadecabacter sp. CECT 8868]|uniref:CpsD/CapB family tyrosine-protein kinase n=1 Tax=Octadecabacter algicola TaxID=2909342 RepID=UPI001F46D6FB|nr:CpsD/CapB family tyrosine-protein kinase [Octadecabacter algicola]MCF2906692.1 CpsD/CapB family tyrosine-protein kinase [Octadecabacter algicola]